MRGCNRRSSLAHQLFKNPLAEVPKDRTRRLVWILWKSSFDRGINVSSRHEQIGVAVIVEIDHPCAPAHVTCFDPETRRDRGIVEIRLPIVAIENIGIVGKVGFENVEMSIE